MSLIEEIYITDAKELLQKEYNAALNRSGRIWNIVKCMSIHPEAMKSSMELYKCLMFAPSPLNRSEREMLAVVVSARNGCVYWIRAHAHELLADFEKDFKGSAHAEYYLLVHLIAKDWKKANLSERPQALCHFAEKVPEAPKQMKFEDLSSLKQTGYSDRAIHDAVPIIGYFIYVNRIADSLGVEPETFTHEWELSAPDWSELEHTLRK